MSIYWNLPNIDKLVGSKCHRIGKKFDWNLSKYSQIGMKLVYWNLVNWNPMKLLHLIEQMEKTNNEFGHIFLELTIVH